MVCPIVLHFQNPFKIGTGLISIFMNLVNSHYNPHFTDGSTIFCEASVRLWPIFTFKFRPKLSLFRHHKACSFQKSSWFLHSFDAHGSYRNRCLPLLKLRCFFRSCATNLCRLVRQLSGTDIQNQVLISLGPLGLAWIFLECPQDLWSDLSVRETEIRVWGWLSCHVEVQTSVPESLGYSIQTGWHSHQEDEAPRKRQLEMLFFKVMATAGDGSCSL